jgi:hypothetical protein
MDLLSIQAVELNRFAGSASSMKTLYIPATPNLLHHRLLEACKETVQAIVCFLIIRFVVRITSCASKKGSNRLQGELK